MFIVVPNGHTGTQSEKLAVNREKGDAVSFNYEDNGAHFQTFCPGRH